MAGVEATAGRSLEVHKHKPRARKDDDDSQAAGEHDFSHPVYKKLSQMNGEVNKLDKEELRERLQSLDLDTSGNKDVLKKRLKNYYKSNKLAQSRICSDLGHRYEHILVIDFEATCESTNAQNYRHEIIEFPVVVVDCQSQTVIDQFHSYVKPQLNPRLSQFCKELTGINQDQVDSAESFPIILDRMWRWVTRNGYHHSMAILTDGPWDMSRFLYLSCQLHGLKFPKWARKWINIRKTFSNFYDCKRLNLSQMLESVGFEFEGQPHCGLDDSKNIARLAIKLLNDGCQFLVNEELSPIKIEQNVLAFRGMAAVAKAISPRQVDALHNDGHVFTRKIRQAEETD